MAIRGDISRRVGLGVLALLLTLALACPAAAVYCPDPFSRPLYAPNQVIVTLQPDKTEADLASFLTETGCRVVARSDYAPMVAVEVPGWGSPVDGFMANKLSMLEKYPAIESMHLNHYYYVMQSPVDIPNDLLYPQQWPLRANKNIFAPEGWAIQKGSEDVVVAVLDTGVRDRNGFNDDGKLVRVIHPDLVGRVLYGYDVTDPENRAPTPSESPNVGASYASHGTHVAGTIAAQANNAMGMAGLCWDGVKILPVKVFPDNAEGASSLDIANGIYYCIQWRGAPGQNGQSTRVNVINMSLGGPGKSSVVEEVVRQAVRAGIVVVASAGNDWEYAPYPPGFPAGYGEVICVGATREDDTITEFSQRGSAMDIVAPGDDVLSTVWYRFLATVDDESDTGDPDPVPPPGPESVSGTDSYAVSSYSVNDLVPGPTYTFPDKYGNTFDSWAGTSMAAPHVSAAAALLISQGVAPNEVREILCRTATPKGIGQPNDAYGWGILNVGAALRKASIDVKISSPINGSVAVTARPRIRIDFRNARRDTIRVWLDGSLVIGPASEAPELGYLGPDSDPNTQNLSTRFYYTIDNAKSYLLFDYPVKPELAVDGSHRLRVTASTKLPVSIPLSSEDTVLFKVEPQELTPGWRLFSIPYYMDVPKRPEELMGSLGLLARWYRGNSANGDYAIYSLDGARTDDGACLTPTDVMINMLAHPVGQATATPPAGLGYWLYVPPSADIDLPEAAGQTVQRPYVIGLYRGWNMVGNPFLFPVEWSNVVVEYAGQVVPAAEAVSKGWISNNIFRYDTISRQYTWRGVNTAALIPWEAQWVRVNVSTPEIGPSVIPAWGDEFRDGVLDTSMWFVGNVGGQVVEAGDYLRMMVASGQHASLFVTNRGTQNYDDFVISTKVYLANSTSSAFGGESKAEVRFRANTSGNGYGLCFNAKENTIELVNTDTGEIIGGRQTAYSLPSGTVLHATIRCVGERLAIQVGTVPGRGDVVDWQLMDNTFTLPGGFWLVNNGMLDCRWDYLRYSPLSVRPPDVKIIIPPNAYANN